MLKFIKQSLESIQNVEVYASISLTIFFFFFVGLIWWVMTRKKSFLEHMEHLPLEDK
jgi:cbb3-type cytochrome oxidase subunit 3